MTLCYFPHYLDMFARWNTWNSMFESFFCTKRNVWDMSLNIYPSLHKTSSWWPNNWWGQHVFTMKFRLDILCSFNFLNIDLSYIYIKFISYELIYFNLKGWERLSANIEEMSGSRPSIYFRIMWQAVTPLLCAVSASETIPFDMIPIHVMMSVYMNYGCLFGYDTYHC